MDRDVNYLEGLSDLCLPKVFSCTITEFIYKFENPAILSFWYLQRVFHISTMIWRGNKNLWITVFQWTLICENTGLGNRQIGSNSCTSPKTSKATRTWKSLNPLSSAKSLLLRTKLISSDIASWMFQICSNSTCPKLDSSAFYPWQYC